MRLAFGGRYKEKASEIPIDWIRINGYACRYDKLLGAFRRPGQQAGTPGASVVGVTIISDILVAAAMGAYFEENVHSLAY